MQKNIQAEIFEDDPSGDDIINKWKNYSPQNKILLSNLTWWDRFIIWWKYGIKVKQL